MACPNELACGNKTLYPLYNGQVLTREVDKYNSSGTEETYSVFYRGDVCSYIIQAPAEMRQNDSLKLKISDIENAEIYVAKGKSYKWINHLDTFNVQEGQVFDTRKDWFFFITGIGTSYLRGSFKIETWVEHYNGIYIPPPVVEEPKSVFENI